MSSADIWRITCYFSGLCFQICDGKQKVVLLPKMQSQASMVLAEGRLQCNKAALKLSFEQIWRQQVRGPSTGWFAGWVRVGYLGRSERLHKLVDTSTHPDPRPTRVLVRLIRTPLTTSPGPFKNVLGVASPHPTSTTWYCCSSVSYTHLTLPTKRIV